MSIKVRLTDGSSCEVSSEILTLTSLFAEDQGELKINTNNPKTVQKMSDFAVYYNQLSKQQKQYIIDPRKLASAEGAVKTWYVAFSNMEPFVLVELLDLSSTLGIKPLMDLCCFLVAEIIRDKPPEAIGELLGIKCDYEEEELKLLQRNIAWTK